MKLVRRPDETALARLIPRYADRPVTYAEVGATRETSLPSGYHHVARSIALDGSSATYPAAREALMGWSMHRRAGLLVACSSPSVVVGATAVMSLGAGPIGIVIPCRVVWVVDEPNRCGFGYGTLSGHPERGEEAFVVERANDSVTFTITAFSAPAEVLVRVGAVVARRVQSWMTNRYLSSLADLSRAMSS